MARIFNRTKEKARRRAFRKSMPEAEVILWSMLKGKQLSGFKFRRQTSIGPFVVDFYCPQKKLAIELDGDSHFIGDKPKKDIQRQRWIEQFGVRFLRYTNDEVRKDLEGVLNEIENVLREAP